MFEIKFLVDRPNALWEALKRLDMPGVYNLTQRPVRTEPAVPSALDANGKGGPVDLPTQHRKPAKGALIPMVAKALAGRNGELVNRKEIGQILIDCGRRPSAVDYLCRHSGIFKVTGRKGTYKVSI